MDENLERWNQQLNATRGRTIERIEADYGINDDNEQDCCLLTIRFKGGGSLIIQPARDDQFLSAYFAEFDT